MPTEILHHEGKFVLWSTVVEAPVSEVLTEDLLRTALYRDSQIGDWKLYGGDWHPLAVADLLADEEGKKAQIERRIARTKRNGCSGLRYYNEPHEGEMWLQRGVFTRQEIFEHLAVGKEPEYRLDIEGMKK